MIRLHPHPTQPDTYRVSVRRRPVGYVRMVHGTKEVRTTFPNYAAVTWVPMDWWFVLDFDLLHPKYPLLGSPPVRPWGYESRHQAISALINWASAQPPTPKAPQLSTQPKPPEVSYVKFIDAWSEETDRLRNMDHSNRKWYEIIYYTIRKDLEIVVESMYGFLSKLRGDK